MKTNPVLAVALAALVVALVYFAYQAGQQNPNAPLAQGMKSEVERLQAEYASLSDQYDADLKELRAELVQRTRELEQSLYALREQLARQGVEIGPTPASRRAAPGPRNTSGEDQAPAGPISKEAYYQLRTNMSLQDVERLLGRKGELSYRMGDAGGTMTENYRWTWINPDGTRGEIAVTFENNRLDKKEFIGD